MWPCLLPRGASASSTETFSDAREPLRVGGETPGSPVAVPHKATLLSPRKDNCKDNTIDIAYPCNAIEADLSTIKY